MRSIAFFLLVLVTSLPAAEPTVTGEWSAPVKGLRGRLLFAEDEPFNGTQMAVVYLELQNVSNVLSPLLVDYSPQRFDVVDAAGKSQPQSLATASIFNPKPYTLVLPLDSTLRFRVSVSGYGIAKDSGISIQLNSGNWVIAPETREDRFLVGTFAVPELLQDDVDGRQKDMARGNRVWRGTLDLPKLKIPLPSSK